MSTEVDRLMAQVSQLKGSVEDNWAALLCIIDSAYDLGKEAGYSEGHDEGYSEGYESGCDAAREI